MSKPLGDIFRLASKLNQLDNNLEIVAYLDTIIIRDGDRDIIELFFESGDTLNHQKDPNITIPFHEYGGEDAVTLSQAHEVISVVYDFLKGEHYEKG